MTERYISANSKETHQLAQNFIKTTLKKGRKINKALVFVLEGELGAGKTEFLKGVAKALKIKEKINSPTFVIMKRFKLKRNDFNYLWHLDLYRLKNIKELISLGFKDLLEDKKNLIFIEWGMKVKKILPKDFKLIKIKILEDNKRFIEINY